MIQIVDLWHHYGIRPTLRGVNLRVEAGELLCVMGPNGMGKSTLLGAVAGIHSPIKGYIEIDGKRRRRTFDEERAIREKLVYLPDAPWVPPNNTGREFVLAVGRLYGVEEDRLFEHTRKLHTLFDIDDIADEPIRSYSTGQKKKIGICAALVTDAPILILDEPFSGGLDSSALHALQSVLRHMANRDDVTIMMAVPVPELVEGIADRIAIIQHGRIIACDTPDGLRALTGCDGALAEVLERVIHPEGLKAIDSYFEEQR